MSFGGSLIKHLRRKIKLIISNKTRPWDTYLSPWRIFIFFSTWLVIGLILFNLSAGRVSLVVDFNSKIADTSQVFFSETGGYSEKNSFQNNVTPGRNILNIPLRRSYSSLRWDPLTVGETIEINNIYTSVFGVRLGTNNISLNPLFDIEKITPIEGEIFVEMKTGAIDPQLNIGIDFNKLYQKHAFFCVILGLAMTFIMLGLLLLKNKLIRSLSLIDCMLNNLFLKIQKDVSNFREVGILVVIGSILYVYFLSTFSFSIDDEVASVRQDPSVWVSQGRWFVYLVEKFIFPQPSIPFAPYIFLIASLSVSYALILRAHGYTASWKTYALYPIFCASPTWWFISEFYSNIPALGFGVFFISSSVYLIFREAGSITNKGSSIRINILIICMIACAIAAYQSLLLLFICVVFGVLFTRCLQSTDTDRAPYRYVVHMLSKVLLLTLLALIFYFSLNVIAQKVIASDSGYIDGFINYDAILSNPLGVFFLVLDEMISIYSGSYSRYGASLYISGIIVVLATFNVLSISLAKTIIRLFLWTGVLVAPFAFHFIAGGTPLPMRTMMAVAYVSWLSGAILLSNKRPTFFLIGAVVVGLYQIQIFSVTSQYMASMTITQSHDRMLAADIYRRIGELSSDFDRNAPLKIDIYGEKTLSTVYANGWQSAMQGSFFSWDGGNIHRMVIYMKVMGYENISVLDTHKRIAMTPIFNEMPVWPAAGSVQKIDGSYLVRLSKEPDPTHAKFVQ